MSLKKTHILLLTSEFPPQPGGIGQHALDLAKHLALGHNVTVIADQRSYDGVEEEEFDQNLNFKVCRIRRFKWLVRTYITRLLTTLRYVSSADVVLVSGKFSLWQVHLIKLVHRHQPIIAIIHGSEVLLPSSFSRKLTDRALQKVEHVVAVSKFTASLVNHLELSSVSVIPNGISEIPELQEKFSPDQKIHLLTVGNLTQRKGQHNVIKALPAVLAQFPQVHYHCVGLPTHLEQLRHLVNELGLNKFVSFHGRVSEQQKQEHYRRSHLFLMLSERTNTGDVEGFGIAILEANTYGLPAIGSSASGIEDAIHSGYSGYLVNPHNKKEIAEAVTNILAAYPQFRKQAYTWSQQFKWGELVHEYNHLIEKLCG